MERGKRSKELARHRELLEIERALWAHGICIGGLDEAGAGPLAGPVVAACVVLDPENIGELVGVDDSKQLSETQRSRFSDAIKETALAFAIAEASVEEIDEFNIRAASLLAMQRALKGVLEQGAEVQHLLVDAREVPNTDIPQSEIIRGDSRSLSIASASILAKVTRDLTMIASAADFPGYGFEKHKGYGTKEHMAALMTLGPCPLHRRSYAPVREAAALDRAPTLI